MRFIFLSPNARTITLCFSGVQITLRISLILIIPGIRLSHLPGFEASQLGYFLTDGYARSFPTEVWVGIVACLLLALVFDLVIQVVSRFLTPWTRAVAA